MSSRLRYIEPSSIPSAGYESDIFARPAKDSAEESAENSLEDEILLELENDLTPPTLYLDPSPIGRETVQSWTRNNRTLRSAFRSGTNGIAVYVSGHKCADEVPYKEHITGRDRHIYCCQVGIPDARFDFVRETHNIFIKLSKLDPKNRPAEYLAEFKAYFIAIQAHLETLSSAAAPDIEQLDLFEDISSIWELYEAVFLVSDDKVPISSQYHRWHNFYDPAPSNEQGQDLLGAKSMYNHPGFWPYIHRCILRGLKNTALVVIAEAIQQNPTGSIAKGLELFQTTLTAMPDVTAKSPDRRLRTLHKQWQNLCRDHADSNIIGALGKNGVLAMRILSGNMESMFRTSQSWQETFGAILYYCVPTSSRTSLIDIIDLCKDNLPEMRAASLKDSIAIAILSKDPFRTIRLCSSLDSWLVAHLASGLDQFGVLDLKAMELDDNDLDQYGIETNVRDFFIIGYAQSLMSTRSLWRQTADYLMTCGSIGRAMAQEFICHVPLNTSLTTGDDDNQPVLKFCKDHDLLEATRLIHSVIAVEQQNKGQFTSALMHLMAADDQRRLDSLVDRLLDRYVKTRDREFEAVARIAEKKMITNKRLLFLTSYAQFHAQLEAGQKAEAVKTLINLLVNAEAPKRYWPLILMDIQPFIENSDSKKSGPLLIDAKSTYTLMQCLEAVATSKESESSQFLWSGTVDVTTVKDRKRTLKNIRLLLVRNLGQNLAMDM